MSRITQSLTAASLTLSTTSTSPRLDAELLLSHVLGWSRSQLRSRDDYVLTEAEHGAYQALIIRRVAREPIAYLVGTKEFWSLTLKVTPAVLVPRPETELLVETILHLIKAPHATIADLGTGSGAIALALAPEQLNWHIIASDVSLEALAVATENAQRLKLTSIEFRHGAWTDVFTPQERFDAIISNPPYLAENDPHLLNSEISHEPRTALVADSEGLADYQILSETCKAFLKQGGLLIFEHGREQSLAVQAILQKEGFVRIHTLPDLAGLPRVTYGYAS